MERTIKFRGKTPQGEWVYGFYHHLTRKANTHFIIDEDNNHVEVIPSTVGQYVGISDKNGIEIYEGDVIKSDVEILNTIVEYKTIRESRYGQGDYTEWNYMGFCISKSWSRDYPIEIIGNTTDSPELFNR